MIERRERVSLRNNLEEIISKEANSRRQKVKFRWVKEGCANSKLFHNGVSSKRIKNRITRLENEICVFFWGKLRKKLFLLFFFQRLCKVHGKSSYSIDGIE